METNRPYATSSASDRSQVFRAGPQSPVAKPNPFQNCSPAMDRLLKARNLMGADLADFLSWDLNDLPDFSSLQDMPKAADRILKAIQEKQKIAVYGDYDVDGTTSCSLFYHFFQMLGIEIKVYQPSRFAEGYGLHCSSIEKAVEDGIDLLLTVDCGITNGVAAELALTKKLDLIITDHHKDVSETMPPAYAVINPNRRDENLQSPMVCLAGVGVAFIVCVQTKRAGEKIGMSFPTLYPLLSFVSIGSICDLVPLNPMNLKLVRHGLKLMKQKIYPGVHAFFAEEDFEKLMVPSEKIAFQVGPLINSKGRLEHPDHAIRLLTAKNLREAKEYLLCLQDSNSRRKFIQEEVFQKAKAQVLQKGIPDKVVVAYEKDWHEGVIGIVASKLVETFRVPAIVLTNSEERGVIKASARSAGNLNLFAILQKCAPLFLKFGGHKAAAGFSMPMANLPLLEKELNIHLAEIEREQRTQKDHFDIDIEFQEITPQLLQELDLLEPYGNGNQVPVFRLRDAILSEYSLLKEKHPRWIFTHPNYPQRLTGISFNYIGKYGHKDPADLLKEQAAGKKLDIYFKLHANFWKGRSYLQLMVERIQTRM